ncbi:unnamed protein product [Urochloa decumbens]|uniref:cysteine dioxygenase n=1 Tax=Urochloa decumbens TaxID=240449 RepID=A0ABC8YHI3_9POAL
MGRSAAGAEGAKVAGPEWLRREDLLKEATAALSGKKRKRGSAEDDGAPWRVVKRRRTAMLVRVPMAMMTVPRLQRLVDACRAVFGGGRSRAPPAPDVVRLISGLMDRIGPDDVGLWDDLGFFLNTNAAGGRQNPPIITCKNILQCKDFTIAVFFLPLRAVMPLHDHPGMTVFSKVLTGSAHVEGYDWVRRPRVFRAGGSRTLAEKVLDREFTPASGTWVLFPESGGNMHRFVAGEDAHCAFLDVIAPPYSLAEQRTCTYYKDSPCHLCRCALSAGLTEEQRSGGRLAWLQEVAMPRDLRIVNLPYRGPTTIA